MCLLNTLTCLQGATASLLPSPNTGDLETLRRARAASARNAGEQRGHAFARRRQQGVDNAVAVRAPCAAISRTHWGWLLGLSPWLGGGDLPSNGLVKGSEEPRLAKSVENRIEHSRLSKKHCS